MSEGAENVLEFLRGSQTALVTFSQGRYISQVKRWQSGSRRTYRS